MKMSQSQPPREKMIKVTAMKHPNVPYFGCSVCSHEFMDSDEYVEDLLLSDVPVAVEIVERERPLKFLICRASEKGRQWY